MKRERGAGAVSRISEAFNASDEPDFPFEGSQHCEYGKKPGIWSCQICSIEILWLLQFQSESQSHLRVPSQTGQRPAMASTYYG